MPAQTDNKRESKTSDEILVLPSWYPNQLDIFAGDFVKRHIDSIALFQKQYILFIIKDGEGKLTKDILETKRYGDNYTEVIIYYHHKKIGINLIDKIRSDRKYVKLYKTYLKKFISEKGVPLLCHVHVAMKAGLVALWMKYKYKVPFVVTEHWTGYLPEAVPRFSEYNLIFKKRTKEILQHANAITVVSLHLANSLKSLYPNLHPNVVPNVVDTNIFYPSNKSKTKPTRFIHASTMTFAKNMEKILEAMSLVKSKGYTFEMELFGPIQANVKGLIEKMSLQDLVFLRGDVSQPTLASEMQKADAMIQFSKYETFSCVVIEANAAGVPVFISNIPVLRELITDNKNGYIVQADDSKALAGKLMAFIDGKLPVDEDIIAANTHKFTYVAVGKKFSEIYSDIINSA